MNNKFSQENAFFKTTQNWLKTLQTKAKRFFIGNMEILALYRPRILKYKFIPEINYAYLVLQKNPNFHLKTPFIKTTQNWLITLQTKAKRFFIEKNGNFSLVYPLYFKIQLQGSIPFSRKYPETPQEKFDFILFVKSTSQLMFPKPPYPSKTQGPSGGLAQVSENFEN